MYLQSMDILRKPGGSLQFLVYSILGFTSIFGTWKCERPTVKRCETLFLKHLYTSQTFSLFSKGAGAGAITFTEKVSDAINQAEKDAT